MAASVVILTTGRFMDACEGVVTGYGKCKEIPLHDGGVHWVYQMRDGSVRDPWKLNMQVPGGHQLCSVHALRMKAQPRSRRRAKSIRDATKRSVDFLSECWDRIVDRLSEEEKRKVEVMAGADEGWWSRCVPCLQTQEAIDVVSSWQ